MLCLYVGLFQTFGQNLKIGLLNRLDLFQLRYHRLQTVQIGCLHLELIQLPNPSLEFGLKGCDLGNLRPQIHS